MQAADPALDERVDAVGELLFGRRLRLRVLLWAADQHQAFNQSEAARGVGYNSSGEVAKELERLVQLHMLRKYGRPGRVGPQNYVRAEHAGWTVAEAARLMLDAEAHAPGPEPEHAGDGEDDGPEAGTALAPLEVLEVTDRRPSGGGGRGRARR